MVVATAIYGTQQTDSQNQVANAASRCSHVALGSSSRKPSSLPSSPLVPAKTGQVFL